MGEKLSIGQHVKRLRMKRGLRIQDLAEKSGISESHISRLENDQRPPTIRALVLIAEPLGCDGMDLVREAGLMR